METRHELKKVKRKYLQYLGMQILHYNLEGQLYIENKQLVTWTVPLVETVCKMQYLSWWLDVDTTFAFGDLGSLPKKIRIFFRNNNPVWLKTIPLTYQLRHFFFVMLHFRSYVFNLSRYILRHIYFFVENICIQKLDGFMQVLSSTFLLYNRFTAI